MPASPRQLFYNKHLRKGGGLPYEPGDPPDEFNLKLNDL